MTAFRKAFRDRDLGFLDEGEQTLGMLIDTWKASPEWERLASSTGRVWGLCGRGRPQALGRRAPVGLRGYAHPQADYRLAQRHEGNPVYRRPQGPDALHRAQARQAGLVQINLAEKIGKLYVKERRAVIIWTNADMAALRAAAVGTRQEGLIDVVELAAAIDLRRADLVRVTWNDIDEVSIRIKAAKMSRGVRRSVVMPYARHRAAARPAEEPPRGAGRRHGTTVRMLFPCETARAEPLGSPSWSPLADKRGNETVPVVEDQVDVGDYAETVLSEF